MDINNLLHSLENESNASIMNLTTCKIKEHKNNALQRLQLERNVLKIFHKKLCEYRYCTDMSDLQYGFYIRWIPLKNLYNLKLTRGAIFCDYKLVNGALHLMCKSSFGKIFQIKYDEVEIFQKLNNQEKILLSVLELLEKN